VTAGAAQVQRARAEQQPSFIAAATSAVGDALIPVPGGVLVRGGHAVFVGAVGISGDTSENDEAAAVAGITVGGGCRSTGLTHITGVRVCI
jgi:uncharacterized protein GlcG (DUF336 family)